MAKRDSFLLRIDPRILAEVRRWSDDEMRSINAQIEYILRQSLKQAGRLPKKDNDGEDTSSTSDSEPAN